MLCWRESIRRRKGEGAIAPFQSFPSIYACLERRRDTSSLGTSAVEPLVDVLRASPLPPSPLLRLRAPGATPAVPKVFWGLFHVLFFFLLTRFDNDLTLG